MERKSLQAVHSIHLVANYLKSEYAERGVPLKKMQVISRGVNVEDIDSLLTYSEPMVGEFNLGTVGRIHPMKDIETIIKGFEIFNDVDRHSTCLTGHNLPFWCIDVDSRGADKVTTAEF